MTVTGTSNRNSYSADGANCVFAYVFEISSTSSLDVYQCGTLITSGYTVSGVGSANGGSVTFTTVPVTACPPLKRVKGSGANCFKPRDSFSFSGFTSRTTVLILSPIFKILPGD